MTSPRATDNIPSDLQSRDQWVVWMREQRNGKLTKIPYCPTIDSRASTIDRTTWVTFEQAVEAIFTLSGIDGYDGIGFVFTPHDPFMGVDLDKCVQDGVIEPRAQQIIDDLDSYTEISPSGTGVHVIVRGQIPGKRNRTGSVEMYDHGRYFCFTGDHVTDTPAEVEGRQPQIDKLYAETFGGEEAAPRQEAPEQPIEVKVNDNGQLPDHVEAAIKEDRRFANTWNKNRRDMHDQSASSYDMSIANNGVRFGWSDQEIANAIAAHRRMHGHDMGKVVRRSDYLQKTIRAARSRSIAASSATDPKLPSDKFKCTDLGNGERFAFLFGDRFRYCPHSRRWMVWTGERWENDEGLAVERCGKATVRAIYQEAAGCTNDAIRKAIVGHARRSESRNAVAAMLDRARSEPPITSRPDDFDADPFLLNVRNGSIDLRTGKLRLHNPDDLITKLCPVDYDQNANCPLWLKFLNEIFDGDQALIQYVQKFLGYALTGDITEQILPVFYGVGANGKSTLLDTILFILNDYAGVAAPDLLVRRQHAEHPTELADLKGKRLVVGSENEKGAELRIQLIKRITGDARIKARFMRQDYFEFDRTFKTILVTNNRPIVDEDSEATWRRLREVPFGVVIPEARRDKKLLQKLKAEGSGILRWMVEGCLGWRREGLHEPDAVRVATQDYREHADALADFLAQCCIVDSGEWVYASELHCDYRSWCAARGERPLKGRAFGDRLKDHGIKTARRHQGRIWVGVSLVDSEKALKQGKQA